MFYEAFIFLQFRFVIFCQRKLAQKLIIKYCRNWLQEIFSADTEVEDGRVLVEDLQPETLQTLIRFIYTDHVRDDELTIELLHAAKKFKIAGVNFNNHFKRVK